MELALFTRGAFIWPVYRNFESFIAALATRGVDAEELGAGRIYPARQRSDSAVHGLPAALDQRLAELHRELYSALLRPVELFAVERKSFADYFWPDLSGTVIDDLLSAFVYYFVRRTASDLPVSIGLNVLRAVFFNHENVAPALWLRSAADRLAQYRPARRTRTMQFEAPAVAKLTDLAFVVATDSRRPAGGPGWLLGRLRRKPHGGCGVRVEYALGPSLEGVIVPDQVVAQLDAEARQALATIFGWQLEEAA
jgi:hypothetical protein